MQVSSKGTVETPMTWTPWVNVVVGIAAIITPFVGAEASSAFRISNVITGIIIVIIALAVFLSSHSRSGSKAAVINLLAGLWLLISTVLTPHAMLVWENVVLGVLATVTASITMGTHGQLERLAWLQSRPHDSSF